MLTKMQIAGRKWCVGNTLSIRFSRYYLRTHWSCRRISRYFTSVVDQKPVLDLASLLVIGGGVGPAASNQLHQQLVRNTRARGDKDHVPVVHVSIPSHIDDRTEWILNSSKNQIPNPGLQMAQVISSLLTFSQTRKVVIGVPCNTFHEQGIWDAFSQTMQSQVPASNIEFVHMLEETVASIKTQFPHAKSIGLMSTTGTRQAKVYHNLLEPQGFQVIEVPMSMQPSLHDTIYNPTFGLKAIAPASATARSNFRDYVNSIAEQGADVVIMGCTEIPLAFCGETYASRIPLLDPMHVLARAMIKRVGGQLTEDTTGH